MNGEMSDFKVELRDLLQKYDVALGVELDGDTHGLLQEFAVLDPFHGTVLEVLADEGWVNVSDLQT